MHCSRIVFYYTEFFTHQHALLGLDVLLHAVVGCAVRGHGTHRTGEWGTSKSWVAVAIGLTQRMSTQIQRQVRITRAESAVVRFLVSSGMVVREYSLVTLLFEDQQGHIFVAFLWFGSLALAKSLVPWFGLNYWTITKS